MILAILVTMLGAASAQTGITVQFYTDTSCSTIQAGGYAAADSCITSASMGGSWPWSFKGSCAALTDTVMKFPRSGATRTGLDFEMYSSGDCTGNPYGPGPTQAPSSRTDLAWAVPSCQTCETLLGQACAGATRAVKFSCGDQTVSASPPPEPPAAAAEPCFPSKATVTLESGHAARMDELRAGDKILAARADGTLYHDTVSRFSLAKSDVTAAFVSLTMGNKQVSLTATHHLPVGPSKTLKQAADVKQGETVWIAEKAALSPQTVTKIDLVIGEGLHNPLLVNGGLPVVDGVATSFNTQTIVTFDSYAVPIVETLCAATGTCDSVRKAVASVECTAKHLVHANPVCKEFKYIDGATAGGEPLALGAAVLAATLATLAWSVRARK